MKDLLLRDRVVVGASNLIYVSQRKYVEEMYFDTCRTCSTIIFRSANEIVSLIYDFVVVVVAVSLTP